VSPERTLVLIRERSFLEVLDLALVVIRRRALTLGLTLVVGALPFALLNRWLLESIQAEDPEAPLVPIWLWLIALESPWATAPLTVVLGGLMFGDRPPLGRVLRVLGSRLIPMVFYQGILRASLLTIVFLVPVLIARLPFLDEVILLERGTWSSVVSRCNNLTRERGSDLFARWIGQVFFAGLFLLAFWFGGTNLLQLVVFQGEPLWIETDDIPWTEWPVQVGTWIAVGFFGVVRFLTYIDQRIRLEGWEIELRMKALGAAMEDPDSW
jgi:hypothetical protein